MKADLLDISFYKDFLRGKNMSDSTITVYMGTIREFLTSNPDIELPETYIDFLIKTAIKKKRYGNFYALQYFAEYKFADNKGVKDNIVNAIKERRKSPDKPTRYQGIKPLVEDELRQVLNTLEEEKHQIMSIIMYETGLRVGDVLRIPQKGIRYDTYNKAPGLRIESLAKGKLPRVVWIWDMDMAKIVFDYINKIDFGTGRLFLEYIKSHNLNFSDMEDYVLERLNYGRYWHDLKQALNTCGIDRKRFAPHSFRRNFARRTWEKHRSIELLRLLMGHARYETSLSYLREDGLDVAELFYELQMGTKFPGK